MASTAQPVGANLALGTRTLPAGDLSEIVELIMESQSALMRAQKLLSGARFQAAWDGTERRLG